MPKHIDVFLAQPKAALGVHDDVLNMPASSIDQQAADPANVYPIPVKYRTSVDTVAFHHCVARLMRMRVPSHLLLQAGSRCDMKQLNSAGADRGQAVRTGWPLDQ